MHITKGSYTEHLTIFKYLSNQLQKDGLKVNASKSCFGAHKIDYLGYYVTRDKVMPIPNKFDAIQALIVPKTHKQLC